jgi:hypothetical protein
MTFEPASLPENDIQFLASYMTLNYFEHIWTLLGVWYEGYLVIFYCS